jgi:hypothetical protein
MRYFYRKPYRYRLTRAPKVLSRARLDNIAIVPASMLSGTEDVQEQVRKLPRRQVLLYHAKGNAKQKRILEQVKEVFQRLGYAVTLLPMEHVA